MSFTLRKDLASDTSKTRVAFTLPLYDGEPRVGITRNTGSVIYNTQKNVTQYYDGASWRDMGGCSDGIGITQASLGETGLVIDQPGNYVVKEALTWSSPLIPAIIIRASSVNLYFQGFTLDLEDSGIGGILIDPSAVGPDFEILCDSIVISGGQIRNPVDYCIRLNGLDDVSTVTNCVVRNMMLSGGRVGINGTWLVNCDFIEVDAYAQVSTNGIEEPAWGFSMENCDTVNFRGCTVFGTTGSTATVARGISLVTCIDIAHYGVHVSQVSSAEAYGFYSENCTDLEYTGCSSSDVFGGSVSAGFFSQTILGEDFTSNGIIYSDCTAENIGLDASNYDDDSSDVGFMCMGIGSYLTDNILIENCAVNNTYALEVPEKTLFCNVSGIGGFMGGVAVPGAHVVCRACTVVNTSIDQRLVTDDVTHPKNCGGILYVGLFPDLFPGQYAGIQDVAVVDCITTNTRSTTGSSGIGFININGIALADCKTQTVVASGYDGHGGVVPGSSAFGYLLDSVANVVIKNCTGHSVIADYHAFGVLCSGMGNVELGSTNHDVCINNCDCTAIDQTSATPDSGPVPQTSSYGISASGLTGLTALANTITGISAAGAIGASCFEIDSADRFLIGGCTSTHTGGSGYGVHLVGSSNGGIENSTAVGSGITGFKIDASCSKILVDGNRAISGTLGFDGAGTPVSVAFYNNISANNTTAYAGVTNVSALGGAFKYGDNY